VNHIDEIAVKGVVEEIIQSGVAATGGEALMGAC